MCPLAPASEIASSHSPATLLPQAIPAHVVPEGATITVAGAATSIGRQLIQALTDAGRDWKIRALLTEDDFISGNPFKEEPLVGVETVLWTPSDSLEASRLKDYAFGDDVAAAYIISTEAGGIGGIAPRHLRSLLQA